MSNITKYMKLNRFIDNTEQINFFSPWIYFPFTFSVFILIGSLRLSTLEKEWPFKLWMILILSIISFYISKYIVFKNDKDLIKKYNSEGQYHIRKNILNKDKVKKCIWFIFSISTMAMTYEYIQFGGIPLFSSKIELTRFAVKQSGYIHIFSVQFKLVMIIIAAYLFNKDKLSLKEDKLFILLYTLSFLFLLSLGQRGEIIGPCFITLLLYHFLKKNIKIKNLIIYSIIAMVFLGGFVIFRKVSTFGTSYYQSLKDVGFKGNSVYIAPLYLTISMNFEILRRLLYTFPSKVNFGYGYYSLFYAFYSLLPGKQIALGDIQNKVWNNGFYAELTSTYLGPLYADFGFIGPILGSFIIGYISNILYRKILKRRDVVSVGLYCFWGYYLMLCTYAYPFQGFNVYLYMFIVYIALKYSSEDRNLKEIIHSIFFFWKGSKL